jgi:hypothetical protein
MSETMLVPSHTLPHRTPVELIILARRGLAEARTTSTHSQRYATAHLAALRAAAAMLAARARPAPVRRRRITSVWVLLAMVAPELGEWSAFFSAGAAKRSAAEAGIARITGEEADQLIAHVGQFIDLVQDTLGLAVQPVLIAS